eukprot:m.87401 g.87401  ORF g.87401 m.87401 type:complete len:52 (-) comp8461_c0_seq2:2398-2553(-)
MRIAPSESALGDEMDCTFPVRGRNIPATILQNNPFLNGSQTQCFLSCISVT